MKRFLFTIAALLTSAVVAAYDFGALNEQHLRPVYADLKSQTKALAKQTAGYCAQPSAESLAVLQQAHIDAFLVWQGAEHLRFGPVQYLSRADRFAFWPDKRSVVAKHLGKLREDPVLTSSDFDISQKSVAVQGFSALERLLFSGKDIDAADCIIVEAIGANLHTMADGVYADWFEADEPFASYVAAPGPENPIFETDQELAGQLLNGLHTELELIVTQKLARPLGSSLEKARGKRAEAWRSGSELAAVAANIAATRQLYELVFRPALDSDLQERIDTAFNAAENHMGVIGLPLREAVSDPEQREAVERLQTEVSTLKALFAKELAPALDLSLGFNSLDGD